MDEVELIYILPLMMILIPSVYVIRAKLFAKIRDNDLTNFEEVNMCGELWFAEGFTDYYDGLTMRRSGLMSDQDYLNGITNTFNAVWNSPGRNFRKMLLLKIFCGYLPLIYTYGQRSKIRVVVKIATLRPKIVFWC
mgnify:CR=1 FL=1